MLCELPTVCIFPISVVYYGMYLRFCLKFACLFEGQRKYFVRDEEEALFHIKEHIQFSFLALQSWLLFKTHI